MSRLVVASNRVADLSKGVSSGGLAVAVGDALNESGGIWFGWDGNVVDDDTPTGLTLERHGSITVAKQALTQTEYEDYYLGFSNNVLWPIFHYRLDLAQFDMAKFDNYRAVNQRFARAMAAMIEPNDLVWIHDYHLIPLAAELRELGVNNRIGFFLHIPFPPPEMFSAIPNHQWLLDSFFAYDLIGFQTDQDLENFKRADQETSGSILGDLSSIRARGRAPIVRSFPIGIDADAFAAMADTDEAKDRIRRLGRGTVRNHIIGVDRLDYSKGLPDRMRAFDRFLQNYPEFRKLTVLMQIAPPTREELTAYSEIRRELEQLSGAINGAYGDFDWTPVRYIHRAVPRDTLAALFRGSKIGLVTPLRDGMNLVAKEYIAAQDGNDPGVLVLSQFAGAADDLKEALIVNPYDLDDVAAAIKLAVTMPLEERQERHVALLNRVRTNDVNRWRQSFLKALAGED